MFESLTSAGLLDQMTDATRAESAAIAERLGLIGQLDLRREKELAQTVFWTVDPFAEVVAEVCAALSISRHRAERQVRQARALRRLPKVWEKFRFGDLDYRMVKVILNRVANVRDTAIAVVDEAIARLSHRWWSLPEQKIRDRCDAIITEHDPDGVRVPPQVEDSRFVDVMSTEPGMAEINGRLHADAAAALDAQLDALAKTVCDADPRTHRQRRADAIDALARLQTRMQCLCGLDDCAAAADTDGKQAGGGGVVVHVFAEQSTLDGTSDRPGYLPGFGIQPAETVRDLARRPGTTIKRVTLPKNKPEPSYRPSAGLADFVRWRDLTCRWPGCDQPAMKTDIDHTQPWPYGPTHASNTKLYCRAHHLTKTFCTGWTDTQLPDGTIELHAPTGHLYRNDAHGATLFPHLGTPTGDLPPAETPEHTSDRSAMMPKRRQTREQDQQRRINTERRERHRLNELAEAERRHQQWHRTDPDERAEPPPF